MPIGPLLVSWLVVTYHRKTCCHISTIKSSFEKLQQVSITMEELSKSYWMNCFKDFAFIEKTQSSNEASYPIFNWQVVNKQVKPVATSHFFSQPIATVASLTTGLSLDFFIVRVFITIVIQRFIYVLLVFWLDLLQLADRNKNGKQQQRFPAKIFSVIYSRLELERS